MAYLFTAGAALAALTLILPHDADFRELQIGIVVGCALLIGVLLYWSADRITSDWQVHAALAAGTTLICLANYYTGTANLYRPALHLGGALRLLLLRLPAAGARPHRLHRGRVRGRPVDPRAAQPGDPLAAGGGHPAGRRAADHATCSTGCAPADRRELRAERGSHPAGARQRAGRVRDARREGVIRGWNRAAERIFGWSASEAIGQPMRTLLTPPEYRDRHDERRLALVEDSDAARPRALRGRAAAARREPLPGRGDRVEGRRARRGPAAGLHPRRDRSQAPAGRARGAAARAGRQSRGGARGRDGQRDAAAGRRRARPPHARRHPVRPRGARARGAGRRRRGDLPRRRSRAVAGRGVGRPRRRARQRAGPVRQGLRRPRRGGARAAARPGPGAGRAPLPRARGARHRLADRPPAARRGAR